MTPDEQTILKLTRETIELATKIKDMELERSGAEMHFAEAEVPRGFEDGNSWDDYGFSERVGVLCGMYKRAKAEAADLQSRLNSANQHVERLCHR